VESAVLSRTRGRDSSPPPNSLIDYITARLRRLCTAAGFGEETNEVVGTVRSLMVPWGARPTTPASKWVSEISDDNTPVEFSVALTDGRADVRVLFEAQADEPTLPAYRAAGLALHGRLEREFGATLDRFRRLQDLFVPEGMHGPFALWSAVVFSRGRRPSFKTYFNPQALGMDQTQALVQEALGRLGLHDAWPSLARSVLRRGRLDELKYFALDLVPGSQARVKVYVRHHDATPDDLERACHAAKSYVPGEAVAFAHAMRGGEKPMAVRAPFTCSAFTGSDGPPASTTVYVPVCAYAQDDAVVRKRVVDYLDSNGIGSRLYGSIVDGFANRPLESGVGMQAWIALRRNDGKTSIMAYLGTEAARVYAPGCVPAPTGALGSLGD
jgi:hypothetical protein